MGNLTSAQILVGARQTIEALRLGGDFDELINVLPGDGAHSQRLAVISGYVGMMVTGSEEYGLRVAAQGLVHDIGKKDKDIAPVVALDRVLTSAERRIVRRHSQEGANLISSKVKRRTPADKKSMYRSMVLSTLRHHAPIEFLAGNAGRDSAHLASAIIGIVDSLDARYDESRIRYKNRVPAPDDDINLRGNLIVGRVLGLSFSSRSFEERSQLLGLPMGKRKLHDVLDYAHCIWSRVNEEVTPQELRFLSGTIAVDSAVSRI